MGQEIAADSVATMVMVVRAADTGRSARVVTKVRWAQGLCELWAADRHHSCVLHPYSQCGHC